MASKDTRSFFKGLNILIAIHAFNASPVKRTLAERVLDLLCKILPSHVKHDPEQDRYDINKTKMDEAINAGVHPLDLSSTISRNHGTRPLPPGSTEVASTMPGQDDGITILSIEDPEKGKMRLIDQIKLDMVTPVEDDGAMGPAAHPAADGESLDLETPTLESEPPVDKTGEQPTASDGTTNGDSDVGDDDEWMDAGQVRGAIENEILFDEKGDITRILEDGLSLINPVERVFSADQNVSAAGGYQDPYTAQAPAISPGQQGEKPCRVPAKSVSGQRCELGDGVLDESDGHAFVCPQCEAAFHEACASLVMEYQGQACPACGTLWSR